MNEIYRALLQGRGAADDAARLNDSAAELDAAARGTVVAPLAHLALIRASGEDAASFLHNLLTNDVKGLTADQAQYSGYCSPKGRLLAGFLLWRDDAGFLLQLPSELLDGIQKRLAMFVLRSKVKLTDASGELALFGIAGTGAAALVEGLAGTIPQERLGLRRFSGGMVLRIDEHRFQVCAVPERAGEFWKHLSAGAQPVGTDAWRWLDIRAGVPRITASTQEEFVPQMVNLELLGGVSFKKGCYPGQEIVARTQHLGRVKRRMYLAHAGGTARPGTALYSPDVPDQACGMVVDAAPAPGGGHDLLAVIQTTSAEGGAVRLDSPDGLALTFQPLPYAVP